MTTRFEDEVDPRTLRRALVRATLGVLVALVPSLLARRFVAVPPCVALVLVPFTLLERRFERGRLGTIFALASLLCAAAIVNGVYLEGVVAGGSMRSGIAAIASAVLPASSGLKGTAGLAVLAQMLGLAFALSIGMIRVDGEASALDPFLTGPLVIGLEVGAALSLQKPDAAIAAGAVFALVALGAGCTGATLIRIVCVAADELEKKAFREVAF